MFIVQATILIFLIVAVVGLTGLLLWALYSTFLLMYGPQNVASTSADIAKMIKLAKLKKSDKIIDLGSGDGAVLLAVANEGYDIDGLEINRILVRRSRAAVRDAGLDDKVYVIPANLWNTDLSDYTVLFLYGIPHIMPKLEQKLRAELQPGARIISNYFQFPNWKPTTVDGKIRLYTR